MIAKETGWSQKSNVLYEIIKQLDRMISISGKWINGDFHQNIPTTTTTTTQISFDELAPSAFALTVLSDTSIQLDWTNNSINADGVSIERSTDGITYVEIDTVLASIATFTDIGLAEGTNYYYRVRAYKDVVYSAYSGVVFEYTLSTEYLAVYAAMIVKPTGNDLVYQNRWVSKIYQIAGAKITYLLNLACHDSQSSLLNWHSPGSQNPTLFNAPPFTPYKGFTGVSTNKMVRTNYNPNTHSGGVLGQNNISVMTAMHESMVATIPNFGSQSTTTKAIRLYGNYNGYNYFRINNASNITSYSVESRRYWTLSRSSAIEAEIYKNKIKSVWASNSDGLCETELWLSGTGATGAVACTSPFLLVSTYLTESEVAQIIDANDEYLNHYSNVIRPFPTNIDFNVLIDGHSFINYQRVGDGIIAKINAVSANNLAVGGSFISGLVTRGATLDSFLQTETSTLKNITAICIGVNDVDETEGKGTIAYNALKSYIETRLSAGHRIFVYTMTPSTSGGRGVVFESERNIFNGLLRSDLALLSNVYILDTDTISELDNPADTTYYSDALHPTWQGSVLLGELLAAKIEELYS